MIKYAYKRSKLLLTSLCDSSWYGETEHWAGRGSPQALVTPGSLAISPGVSPQRTWAVHTHTLSGPFPDNSICRTYQRGSNASRGERATVFVFWFGLVFFFFASFLSQSLLKAQDTAAGELSSPGFKVSRPSPSSPGTQQTLSSPPLNDVSLWMVFQHRNCGFKRKSCSVALGAAQHSQL